MSTPETTDADSRKRALVLQQDPHTRVQICDVLTRQGFEVDECSTLAEGRASYQMQPLVVTSTDQDAESPSGFIAWLREKHENDEERCPYILAVGDRESTMSTPPTNRAWDELLTTPLTDDRLQSRLSAIEAWVEKRFECGPEARPSLPRMDPRTMRVSVKAPGQDIPHRTAKVILNPGWNVNAADVSKPAAKLSPLSSDAMDAVSPPQQGSAFHEPAPAPEVEPPEVQPAAQAAAPEPADKTVFKPAGDADDPVTFSPLSGEPEGSPIIKPLSRPAMTRASAPEVDFNPFKAENGAPNEEEVGLPAGPVPPFAERKVPMTPKEPQGTETPFQLEPTGRPSGPASTSKRKPASPPIPDRVRLSDLPKPGSLDGSAPFRRSEETPAATPPPQKTIFRVAPVQEGDSAPAGAKTPPPLPPRTGTQEEVKPTPPTPAFQLPEQALPPAFKASEPAPTPAFQAPEPAPAPTVLDFQTPEPIAGPPALTSPPPSSLAASIPFEEPTAQGPVQPHSQPVERRFQAMIDNAPIAMALFDQDMRYLAVNRRFYKEFALEGVDVIGRCHFDVFPELGWEWKRVFRRALDGTPERCPEDLWVREDGNRDWVRWEVTPWHDEAGTVQGVTIICEIINHLIDQREPDDLEQSTRSLMRGKVTPMLTLDLEGRILYSNDACRAYAGDRDAELKGLPYWDVFASDEGREQIKRMWQEASRQSRMEERFAFPPSSLETMRTHGTGRIDIIWTNTPRYDDTGRLAGVIRVGARVPDNLSAPTTAVAGPDLSRIEALEQLAFGIMILDANQNVLYANGEHARLLGVQVKDFAELELWLASCAPDPGNPGPILEVWRDQVWRKQLTRVLTLRNQEKALREIEFRPSTLAEGGMLLTLFDVTEKRRWEEALRASEAKFRALFQDAGVAIALEDASGKFFDVNQFFERLVNAPRHEIRRSGIRQWLADENWSAMATAISQLRDGDREDVVSLEIPLRRTDGSPVWTRATISRVGDHTGRIIFTAYYFQDIDRERRNTDTLQVARNEQRALLNAIPDLILMLDGEGTITDLIPAASGLLVENAQTAVGQKLVNVVPGLRGNLEALMHQVSTGSGGPVEHEFRDERTGRYHEARLVRCGEGQYVMIIQDETATLQAREAVARHSLVFDHTRDAVIIANLKGRITDWNPAAQAQIGYSRDEATGQSLSSIYSPHDRSSFNNHVAAALSEEGVWTEATTFYRSDGSTGQAEVYYLAVEESPSRPASILGIHRQIETGTGGHPGGGSNDLLPPAEEGLLARLLETEITRTDSAQVRSFMHAYRERLRLIALTRQLIQTGTTGQQTIDLPLLIKEVREFVLRKFAVAPDEVRIRHRALPAEIPARQALPAALMLQELLSEILQSACDGDRRGNMGIRAEKFEDSVIFRIEDDGLGFPSTLFDVDGSALSMDVIRVLAEAMQADFAVTASPVQTLMLQVPIGSV